MGGVLPRRKWLRRTLIGGLAALGGSMGGIYQIGRASLPVLSGQVALAGLGQAVTVDRDIAGVATIKGTSRIDVARATGFIHAQERFFQMDLLRRRAAGELSEIIGPATVEIDERVRVHRLRHVAERVIASANKNERELIDAYVAGVNAGLQGLGARRYEYWLLRTEPRPWVAEDSVLCVLAMFLTLHDTGEREAAIGVMRDALPPALFDFLVPRGVAEWDAPIVGDPIPMSPLPGPEVFDLRTRPALPKVARLEQANSWNPDEDDPALARSVLGSNNWAVDGTHTKNGGALVANDMHLDITVPNIWFRVRLEWKDADGNARAATGVSLPGVPAVVAGSNGRMAWGFTNTQADWSDLVVIDPVGSDSYATPTGPAKFVKVQEEVRVKGEKPRAFEVTETIWGPVVDRDHAGRLRALKWTAHDPEAVNLALVALENASTIEETIAIASHAGMPPQNMVMASQDGRIAWTVAGRIPRRVGFEGREPTSWADGKRRWDGWISESEQPRVIAPAGGRLWTANSRVVSGEMLKVMGEGNYPLGARQKQIRDDLMALDKVAPQDLLNIQLDDRAIFLGRWRDLALSTLSGGFVARDKRLAEAKSFIDQWGGRAATSSVGYRLVRAFRAEVNRRAFTPIIEPCLRLDPKFSYGRIWQNEGPLWELVTKEPVHLLGTEYKTWTELREKALFAVVEELTKDGRALKERTWGERNRARIQHPLSQAVPSLGRFLDMPKDELNGDDHMPRVASPSNGSSERFVVSPGREAEGLFHMPSGQSSHPLSPYFGTGHHAWVTGEPTPFLPGSTVYTLTLSPR